MSDTVFLGALDLLEQRVSQISKAAGFFHDLGQSVYIEGLQPVPRDDAGLPLSGSIIIDPGEMSSTPDSGEIRQSAARVEAIFERTVSIVVTWPLPDKDAWLITEQQIGSDLRQAILKDMHEWHARSVQRLAQTGQESGWPQPGSTTLHVKTDYLFRYVES